ncbi:aminoglycoside phosphotransferase family protein [Microbacterium deminutum]|uniref:Aminoglycoside phosphotransferase domain-containing protein n=1 Tax=Microbacterium deminutum TaxID=344164 RepID=A0ABN2QW31_9MICO
MADDPSTRIARLIVCDADGAPLGTTPDFAVASPYWGHVEPLVAAARDDLGLSIVVLRLLTVERGAGGEPDRTTYLAEHSGLDPALTPVSPSLLDEALRPRRFRMPWARPGGPAAHFAWAEEQLAARGIRRTAPPIQVRTWNLSSIWRVPTTAGTVWLKAVPPFFAHEGRVLERVAGYAVPQLLGHGDGVVLLADVAGDDLYAPAADRALAMVDALISIQRGPGADVDALRGLGLPDWRLPSLAAPAHHVLRLRARDLDAQERRSLEKLIDGLDGRLRDLAACGIPDTLVHGDFHPGNTRGTAVDLTILDWGDSGVGHPLLDMAAFTERMPPAQRAAVEAHWIQSWEREVPGSDAGHAASLVSPVGALRQAVIYRHFLDHIEPDERIYHETDDLLWLRRTAALLPG